MALSDQEQQLLAQLEASLAADDPKLASTLRGHSIPRRLPSRTATTAIVGEILGAAVLVAGLQWHWLVSVLGFVLMFAAAVHAVGGKIDREADADPLDDRSYARADRDDRYR